MYSFNLLFILLKYDFIIIAFIITILLNYGLSLKTAEPLIKRSGGPFLGEGPRAMLEENLRLTEVLEQKKDSTKVESLLFHYLFEN